MKKTLFIISLFSIAFRVFAQDCTDFYYMQKAKTFEMTYFDKNNKPTLKAEYKVDNVKTVSDTVISTVTTDMFSKDGKEMGKTTMEMKCNGGVMYMDFNNVMSSINQQTNKEGGQSMKITFTHSNTEYPTSLQVGQQFPDATSTMTMGTDENQQIVTTKTTDRKVLSKEDVTTPAGTWSCYKIYSKSTSTTSYKGAIADPMAKLHSIFKPKPRVSETTVYYAPGFGIIKFESASGSMELTAVSK